MRPLRFFALVVVAALVPLVSHGDTGSIEITNGIPSGPVAYKGEVFHQVGFSLDYASGPVILAANPDGTGPTLVDDALDITVSCDGNCTPRSFSHNYYFGNCDGLSYAAPFDLTTLFSITPGLNHVTVTLRDVCGGEVSATSLWLSYYVRIPTTLRANPVVASVLPGVKSYLKPSASLSIQDGRPVADAELEFRVGNETICTATTNEEGYGECIGIFDLLDATLALGYDVRYMTNGTYSGSNAHGSILIVNESPLP